VAGRSTPSARRDDLDGFDVRPGALEEFACTCDVASGRVAALDPGKAATPVPAALPGTATAAAMTDLAIALAVSCQAVGGAFAAPAGRARASAAQFAGADDRSGVALSRLSGAA